MNPRCGLLLLLGLGSIAGTFAQGGFSNAQEAPPAEPPPAEAEQPPREPPLEGDRRAGGADDVFIPSEELAADEEATFPVDI